MKTTAIIISIIVIIFGQFAKYRYDVSKGKEAKVFFFKSKFFWSALYEIGIIFLGAILAIQLTEVSELKLERQRAINVLEQAKQVIAFDSMVGEIPLDIEKYTDEQFTDDVRDAVYTTTINQCNIVENIISQSDIQSTLSSRSYVRFMGIIARKRSYANDILTSTEPSLVYKDIQEEKESILSCLSMEIEFQKGIRTEKELGNWIGRTKNQPSVAQ